MSATHELEITRWVEWFRGVNDPQMQWKVAERQLNMLKAEKRITHWEIATETPNRPARVILYAASNHELRQLEKHIEKVFPKVPRDAPWEGDESDTKKKTLRQFLRGLGEGQAKRRTK